MHDLITKYFGKELTPVEEDALFFLLKTDAKLKAEFIFAQNLYALTALLPQASDTHIAFVKLKKNRRKRRTKSFLIYLKRTTGYAAVIALSVLSTWMVINRSESTQEQTLVFEEFTTPSGQRAMLKLYDGTTVWLNAQSKLRYPHSFSKGERRVELDGEAFFDVAHNKDQPFIVSTEKVDIKVLGTKFNVFAYKSSPEFKAALLEGSIDIYRSHSTNPLLSVHPHESVELVDDKLIKNSFENMDFLLWKDGIYAFDDMPFGEILKKLELYYDVTIVLDNRKLNAYKFSGKFRQRDGVENVLRTLQNLYHFSYIKDEEHNTILIQ